MKIKTIIFAIIGVLGISFFFSTFEQINAGQRGVVLQWGAYDRTLEEGFHFVNPISEDVITMEVRVQLYETSASAASRDLQTVNSTVALNYHPNPKAVGPLYQNVGRDYENQIVKPAIQESVKAGTALYTAEELISKRAFVKEAIKEDLVARLEQFNLIVDDFSIINFDFSSEFNAAIEAKQVAEQKALQAQNDLKRVELEAQQAIEKSKAEAESTRLQAQALSQSSSVIELRKVEAMLEFAKKWDGKLPINIYGSAPLPLLDVTP